MDPRLIRTSAILLPVLALAIVWHLDRGAGETEIPFEVMADRPEPEPPCPWREPEADMNRFFPGANGRSTETRIFSGRRVELAGRLGRPPQAGENALILHRIHRDTHLVGTVLTRRVKGEHGAIELVAAFDRHNALVGLRLQRLREPPDVAAALEHPGWLDGFHGRTPDAGWDAGDIEVLPDRARVSASAIREAVRSLVVLLSAAGDFQPSKHSIAHP